MYAFEASSRRILSPTGKAQWNREAISKLLSNEKYLSWVLLQKAVSYCGMRLKKNGEQQILIKNHHQAIITIENFDNVQEMKMPVPKIKSNQ